MNDFIAKVQPDDIRKVPFLIYFLSQKDQIHKSVITAEGVISKLHQTRNFKTSPLGKPITKTIDFK